MAWSISKLEFHLYPMFLLSSAWTITLKTWEEGPLLRKAQEIAHTIHPIIHLLNHTTFPPVRRLVPSLFQSTPQGKKVCVMFNIKMIEMSHALLSVSALHNNFSVPVQAQHQTTVMPLSWMNTGVPVHPLLSHYLLNLGIGVQIKALLTNPRVSSPAILPREVLTKGNFILHLY